MCKCRIDRTGEDLGSGSITNDMPPQPDTISIQSGAALLSNAQDRSLAEQDGIMEAWHLFSWFYCFEVGHHFPIWGIYSLWPLLIGFKTFFCKCISVHLMWKKQWNNLANRCMYIYIICKLNEGKFCSVYVQRHYSPGVASMTMITFL